jgi:hypothetical protein
MHLVWYFIIIFIVLGQKKRNYKLRDEFKIKTKEKIEEFKDEDENKWEYE